MIVAGYDVSYSKYETKAVACLSVFDADHQVIEEYMTDYCPSEEYVPGQLWKREVEGLETLLPMVNSTIDCLVIDGCGTIHPDRFGAACEYSQRFGIPTIGCAKSLFVGEFGELASEKGSKTAITLDGDLVGFAFRSATDVKPIFISSGCDMSQEAAVGVIEQFCYAYRIPEVTRRPDMASRKRLRELGL